MKDRPALREALESYAPWLLRIACLLWPAVAVEAALRGSYALACLAVTVTASNTTSAIWSRLKRAQLQREFDKARAQLTHAIDQAAAKARDEGLL